MLFLTTFTQSAATPGPVAGVAAHWARHRGGWSCQTLPSQGGLRFWDECCLLTFNAARGSASMQQGSAGALVEAGAAVHLLMGMLGCAAWLTMLPLLPATVTHCCHPAVLRLPSHNQA